MRLSAVALSLAFISSLPLHAASEVPRANYSTRMALSIIYREQGVLTGSSDTSALLQAGFTQKAFRRLVEQYPNAPVSEMIQQYVTKSVNSVASPVSNATKDLSYSMDRLSSGNNLIDLYKETRNATYRQAFQALRESINLNSRNAEGGLWYYVYPEWSYLDGMYSLAPYYTTYTVLYDAAHAGSALSDMQHQLDLLWVHCRNNASGLLVHGYDASRTAVWANPVTGASPHVWGRSLGWYTMALVDTLEVLPLSHRAHLQSRFRQLASAVAAAADPLSGGWWQVLDQPERAGNYIESSGSAMFVYSLLKGVRLGYLEQGRIGASYTDIATLAYKYIANTFVVNNGNGTIGYNGTVSVCSLNSTASYEYYIGQPINYNSVLGSAAFVLASLEFERLGK